MEEALYRTMLFDFYGELLTEKQREFFNLHYNEDLSLAEIAQDAGVSRQAVWDNIRRAEDSMRNIEEKTGLVQRFSQQRELLISAAEEIEKLLPITSGRAHDIAQNLGRKIQELQNGI